MAEKVDVSTIEAKSTLEVVWKIRHRGFALCRSVLSKEIIDKHILCIAEPLDGPRHTELLKLTIPGFFEIFSYVLGVEFDVTAADLNKLIPTVLDTCDWHQDGGKRVSAWMPIMECGVDAPGIKLVPKAFDALVPGLSDAYIESQGWPILTPRFQPGDVLFFNGYSVFGTYSEPAMLQDRVVLKLMARPKSPIGA